MRKLRFYQLHSVRFAPCGCPFLLKEKEQAEVGQRPTFLAHCYRKGGWKYTPGILVLAEVIIKSKNGILNSILINTSAYEDY